MGLGSSCLEKVVIPYANSPSTNPIAKVSIFQISANDYPIFFPPFSSSTVVKSADNEIRSKAVPFWKALPSQRITQHFDYPELSGLSAYPVLIIVFIPSKNKKDYEKERCNHC